MEKNYLGGMMFVMPLQNLCALSISDTLRKELGQAKVLVGRPEVRKWP